MAGVRVRGVFSQLSASLEWLVSLCVNHEAQMEASLQEVQERLARASLEIGKVRADHIKLCEREQQLAAETAAWTERAKRFAEEDREKALECLRRRRGCADALKKVSTKVSEHGRILIELEKKVADFKESVDELKRRKHILKLKSQHAVGNELLDGLTDLSFERAEKVLDEWEVQIARVGDAVETKTHVVTFEEELKRDEERAELEAELVNLLAK